MSKIRITFDVWFDEIVELDDKIEIAVEDIIPQHMKKKYGLIIKMDDVSSQEIEEVKEIVK